MAAKKRSARKTARRSKAHKPATWANMLPKLPAGKILIMDPSSPSGFRAPTHAEVDKYEHAKFGVPSSKGRSKKWKEAECGECGQKRSVRKTGTRAHCGVCGRTTSHK